MINFRIVTYYLGILLAIEGLLMSSAVPVTIYFNNADSKAILTSALITFFLGIILWVTNRNCSKTVGKREGYIIVALSWFIASCFGALPFYISNAVSSYTNAFFESISGFTATGASVINNIETLSKGLIFWRSLTQWLGGMGIIASSMIILPFWGIGGMQLFTRELAGSSSEKYYPRMKETAIRLFSIYLIITVAEVIFLYFGGMTVFDAVCHSFSTLSTGGFSTRQTNIAYFTSPYIQYVLIAFMIVAGANFSLSLFVLHTRLKEIWRNEEFRAYLSFIGIFTLVITLILIATNVGKSYENSFRESFFQVVSIITTTGFYTTNYLNWNSIAWILLVLLMFLGSSVGSTGGSIKSGRILVLLKNGFSELKRFIHPNAIIPVRLNKEALKPDVIHQVLVFVTVYIFIVFIGIFIIAFLGYDLETSIGAVIATLGNIGPGMGEVAPFLNYSQFSELAKWFLSLLMLVGRLEILIVLVIFSPSFWKK